MNKQRILLIIRMSLLLIPGLIIVGSSIAGVVGDTSTVGGWLGWLWLLFIIVLFLAPFGLSLRFPGTGSGCGVVLGIWLVLAFVTASPVDNSTPDRVMSLVLGILYFTGAVWTAIGRKPARKASQPGEKNEPDLPHPVE